jgi:hypothetical protein
MHDPIVRTSARFGDSIPKCRSSRFKETQCLWNVPDGHPGTYLRMLAQPLPIGRRQECRCDDDNPEIKISLGIQRRTGECCKKILPGSQANLGIRSDKSKAPLPVVHDSASIQPQSKGTAAFAANLAQ